MWRRSACVALVVAGISAALFSVCAAGLALAPPASIGVLGDLLHLELRGLPRQAAWEHFIGAFVAWTLGAALVAALICRLAARRTAPRGGPAAKVGGMEPRGSQIQRA